MEIKKATTYDEQLEILRNRGAIIVDDAFCRQKLAEINYYRLTAYFLPFRKEDGNYAEGTSFHTVIGSMNLIENCGGYFLPQWKKQKFI